MSDPKPTSASVSDTAQHPASAYDRATASAAAPRSLRSRFLPVAGILVLIVLLAGGACLHNRTLVSWWLPVEIAVLLATLMLVVIRAAGKRAWDLSDMGFCWLLLFGVSYFGVLAVNSLGLDPATARETELMVTNKYEKRHTSRRPHSGIRQTHTTRHVVVRSESGAEYELDVSDARYARTPVNRPMRVRICDGRLGFGVIADL